MRERLTNGFSFINRIINPLEKSPRLITLREMNAQLLERAPRKNKK